jgi:hypothetical protein
MLSKANDTLPGAGHVSRPPEMSFRRYFDPRND